MMPPWFVKKYCIMPVVLLTVWLTGTCPYVPFCLAKRHVSGCNMACLAVRNGTFCKSKSPGTLSNGLLSCFFDAVVALVEGRHGPGWHRPTHKSAQPSREKFTPLPKVIVLPHYPGSHSVPRRFHPIVVQMGCRLCWRLCGLRRAKA